MREAFDELQNRLSEESRRLQMLLDVTALLSSSWDLSQVFPQVSARIRRVLHHEYAAIALHDPGTGALVREAIDFPLSKGFTSGVHLTTGNSPSGRVLQERTPRIFAREELLTFQGATAERFLAEGLQSMCCVPRLRPKIALGVLALGSTRPNAFTQKDMALLEQVAAQFAVAIGK